MSILVYFAANDYFDVRSLMQLSDFDFSLPEELIAQKPIERRDGSRMLVVDRARKDTSDRLFTSFVELLRPTDLLVLNNTKVFPARLIGHTSSGAKIEIFLVNENAGGLWETLARPARRLQPGKRIDFDDTIGAEVVEKLLDGKVVIRFDACSDLYGTFDSIGKTPLPPYIKREASLIDTDRERYQTVFAKNRGAIAAPTAGLHFTPEVMKHIRQKGVSIAEITLHVGYGTFEPVRVDDLSEHRVSAERYEISDVAASQLSAAKADGRRIVAVGTTTTRALESTISKFGQFVPGQHLADITITPGYEFAAVDALLTNFHLPQSSLLVLTSTFGGHELIMSAYRHAVAERYRFYSYGDCMLIV
ncbi:MAG: tRNA preQ1(34) S-adenosylmethionine ribosyltransferase-isomerase QueA [Pyrinomonadaceae bacterium]